MRRILIVLFLACLTVPGSADAKRRHRHRPPPRVVATPPAPPRAAPHRAVSRSPSPGLGYVWMVGHWGPNGVWVGGNWVLKGAPPRQGWLYVSGYWKSGAWISGFWRPPARAGFIWVDSWADERGVYHPGYWEPTEEGPPNTIWRPGYWDGSTWIPGAWVHSESYTVYGEDGELDFIGFGDGQIEELAISADDQPLEASSGDAVHQPAPPPEPFEEEAAEPLDSGEPDFGELSTMDIEDSEVEGTDVRHHMPPD